MTTPPEDTQAGPSITDPTLNRIVECWAQLPEAIRGSIGAIVNSFISAAAPASGRNTPKKRATKRSKNT